MSEETAVVLLRENCEWNSPSIDARSNESRQPSWTLRSWDDIKQMMLRIGLGPPLTEATVLLTILDIRCRLSRYRNTNPHTMRAMASPAMGHWGTWPLDFQLFNFLVTSEPRKLWNWTLCVCLPRKKSIQAYSFVTVCCMNFIILLCVTLIYFLLVSCSSSQGRI